MPKPNMNNNRGKINKKTIENYEIMFIMLPMLWSFVRCQIIESSVEIRRDSNVTDISRAYCFRFTWLGPKYNAESQFKNASCSDVIKGDKTIPCTHPLVVTS